jgi:hypothetical protein
MPWRRTTFLALLLLCLGLAGALHAAGAEPANKGGGPVIGWVEVKPAPGDGASITIVGHAYAAAEISGRFVLAVSRSGKGGSAQTSQSGAFQLSAGQQKALSTTAINLAPGQSVSIELKLMSGSTEVSSVLIKTARQPGGRDI